MKKLFTILLVLISFSSFAQFEAGEYINSDTVKIDGVPLLLNTFKQGNLGGASNIFYSTGASSQPASGTVNQVIGGNSLTANYVPMWDGRKLANSNIYQDGSGNVGIGFINPFSKLSINGGLHVGGDSDAGDNNILADGTITGTQLISNIPTGTPPLVVASSTKVDSLNAGLFDGKKASDFQLKSDTLTFDATLSDLQDSSAAIRSLANTKAVVSGTDNYIMKKTGANTLGNSSIIDNGSTVTSTLPIKGSSLYAGTSLYANGYIELGCGQTGNRNILIDFTSDDTYTDYGLRMIRFNTGVNAPSVLYHRGKGDFSIITQDAGQLTFATKNTTALIIDTLQNAGFGTQTPAARIHSQSTGTQARLGYDATKYTDLSTGSTGNLTIDPTGDTVKVVGAVNSTGGFFKNGVEITGGGGGMVYPPAGLAKSTGTGWATSITDNSTNWTAGYNYRVIAAGATAPLYLSLSGNVLSGYLSPQLTAIGTLSNSAGLLYNNGSGSFSYKTAPSGAIVGTTDSQALTNKSVNGVTLSTGAGTTNFLAGDGTYKQIAGWTSDTYGINYSSGNVGIGTASHSTSKLYVNGSITNNGSDRAALDLTWSNGQSTIVSYNESFSAGASGVFAWANGGIGINANSVTNYGGKFTGLGIDIATGNLDIAGTTRINSGGFFQPVSSSDASAPNNSIYYSTTQSKLVYKNASGTVNVLY